MARGGGRGGEEARGVERPWEGVETREDDVWSVKGGLGSYIEGCGGGKSRRKVVGGEGGGGRR